MVLTPWFRHFLDHDPRPALRQVTCPVLALNGEKDVQVPADVNLKAIAAALKEAGNPDVTTRELPGLNHLFQTSKTGSVTEYGSIEETMAPAALEAIASWVLKRAGKGGTASTSGISQGSEALARKPSVSSITGVMWCTASRTASRAIAKQSAGVAAASTTIGASPLRPITAW